MYTRILVPVDGSTTSSQGLAEAIKLAQLTGARLKLLHVTDLLSFATSPEAGMGATPQLLDLLREGGQAVLDEGKAAASRSGVAAEMLLVDNFAGRLSDLVVDEAVQWGADLIVIGTHGRRGVGSFLLGSDAEQIVRH